MEKLTKPIPVQIGIGPGNSLSPLLLKIVIDQIIQKVRQGLGYRLEKWEIQILCYADDAALISGTEDDL